MKSRRWQGLRWSLLAAAGIIPVACGEEPVGDSRPGAGGEGIGGSEAGAKSSAGDAALAGDDAGGMSGSGGSSGRPPHSCTRPMLDEVSGLVSCEEGYSHRPSAVACPVAEGGSGPTGMVGGSGGEGGTGELPRVRGEVSCFHKEEACQAFHLGYCNDNNSSGGNPAACYSGCVDDRDCGDGYICVCGGPSPTGGVCHVSDCQTDDECGPGFRCAEYSVPCGYAGFACQRAEDECTKDDDCQGAYCGFNGLHRVCDGVACGRPFLVQQQPRLPELANRDDWLIASDPGPRLDHLSERERESLATHWAKLGQMEHASIAAFARFTLQLLSLGAPPELVDESTRALADETAHARLCFSIASAYAGSPIGPGPLHVDGSLVTTSLADLVDLVIAEGCVGETRAAVEALDAADVATDPAIRATYLRIAADEQRHAQLAFRFLRFALERNPSTVRERLAVACDALSNDQVARQVTLPCLQALQRQRLPIGVPHVPVAIAT